MIDIPQTSITPRFRPGIHRDKVLAIAQPGSHVVFYDTETTGLNPEDEGDHIIEFSGILCRIENDYTVTRLKEKQIYIKNHKPLTPKVIEITKLTEEFLSDKPTEKEVVRDIVAFLRQGEWTCGHNVEFDHRMIATTLDRNNLTNPIDKYLDTWEMALDILVPNTAINYKLETLATAFNLNEGVQFHSAIADIGATVSLFEILLKQYAKQSADIKVEPIEPKIRSVSYWSKETDNGLMERIYVNTNCGSIYFNCNGGFMGSKALDTTRIDRKKFEQQVMNFIGVNTLKELLQFRGKK